jgi:hypothetical protein
MTTLEAPHGEGDRIAAFTPASPQSSRMSHGAHTGLAIPSGTQQRQHCAIANGQLVIDGTRTVPASWIVKPGGVASSAAVPCEQIMEFRDP